MSDKRNSTEKVDELSQLKEEAEHDTFLQTTNCSLYRTEVAMEYR